MKKYYINLREPYRSYLAVKAENPDSLVLYQVGDFFEAYGEDAQKVAEALDLVMTSRAISDSERVPMVGFPQHALETYMNMLTDRGFDLAVSTVDGSERKVLSIVSTNKEDPVQSKPIGRIDYLHTDGRVRESIEYTSPYQFEKDIKEENYYGVPMKIVLYKDRDGTTIPQDFISQLDPSPQGVEIIDSPYLKSSLDIAKEIIDEYCREEFERDEGADYSNLSEVNVAYTTTEDDKHEIQANVNLVDFKIETLVDGTVIRTEQYDSLEDMTERGLKNLSFDDLAKQTNVDTNNRLICYDILDLGKQLMPIGMLVVLDSILNRITQNRAKGKNTYIFIDEIYLLFQHEYSANFLFTLWKRVRKYGAYATGITQNVDDLLQSHTARTMLANSEFIIMLNQASTDRLKLAELLNISDLQMSYITNVEAGHGLLKVGSSLVPFANKFPKNTKLYKLMTTKPGESA